MSPYLLIFAGLSVAVLAIIALITRSKKKAPADRIKDHMGDIRKGQQSRKGGAVHMSWDQRKKRLVLVIYEAPQRRVIGKPKSRWLGAEFELRDLLAKVPVPTIKRYVQEREKARRKK